MEVKPQALTAFLSKPPPAATFLYGSNQGLVREAARSLVEAALEGESLHSAPLGLSRLTAEQIAAKEVILEDEARAITFGSGRRILWLEGAAEKCASQLQNYLKLLDDPEQSGLLDAVLVAEGGLLRKNHKLVQAFAKSSVASVAACYNDEAGAHNQLIKEYFPQSRISSALRQELAARLAPDRMLARRELEKLALLTHNDKQVTPSAILLAVADNAESDLDDLCYAITAGQRPATHEAFCRLVERGG